MTKEQIIKIIEEHRELSESKMDNQIALFTNQVIWLFSQALITRIEMLDSNEKFEKKD